MRHHRSIVIAWEAPDQSHATAIGDESLNGGAGRLASGGCAPDLRALAADRPAYGDEVKNLVLVEVCRGSRLAGFASVLMGLGWLGTRS